jgi:hypothetical protein
MAPDHLPYDPILSIFQIIEDFVPEHISDDPVIQLLTSIMIIISYFFFLIAAFALHEINQTKLKNSKIESEKPKTKSKKR